MLGPPAPPKVPAFPTPRTAISVRELPEGDAWLYEVKRDGSPDSATMTDSRMRSSGVAGVVKLDSTSLPDGPVSAQLRPEARIGRNPLKLTLARACDLSLHPAGLSAARSLGTAPRRTRDDGLAWRRPARRSLSHRRRGGPVWAPRVLRPWEEERRCLWHSPRGAERSRQRNSRDDANAARNH